MGMDKVNRRFRGILAEVEEFARVCNQCDGPLVTIDSAVGGVGCYANLPLLQCPECEIYFVDRGELDDSEEGT